VPSPTDRSHEIVVYGATGFTGELTAEYLARNAPADLRWALAGRNRQKLEAVRDRLAAIEPRCAELPLLHADADDPASLRAVTASAKAIITTVGPYIRFGEPLVAACAAEGTDYLDLTGEPEFVDRMYVAHHSRAVETGARIVHACGFDSIPPDLGAYFTVKQLPEGVPIRVEGFVSASGLPSGGTLDSALTAMSRARQTLSATRERRSAEPDFAGPRKVRSVKERPRREPRVGGWALPMPTIDPQIVRRSARALERYGPDFSYGHYFVVKHLPVALGVVGGLGGLFALSQLPPARRFILSKRASGEGPSAQQREQAWFKLRFIGEGGGERVLCEVTGGDPGYGETAKMLAEAALCLVRDELPESAGQVTTAVAMGDALLERLQRAGISFKVVEP